MSLFDAFLLGILQGLTEFLPVSSTGHLVLAREFFGVVTDNALAIDAVMHLATAAAVIVYFRRDLMTLFHTCLRLLARMPVNACDRSLLTALAIGTLPAAVLGMLLESWIETTFRDALFVATILILGSILFAYAEWRYLKKPRDRTLTLKTGFIIGLFQSLALMPGMSRSGATIVGGMLLGLTREAAARFAFLLSIPIILGAGGMKLVELMTATEVINWGAVVVGAVAAFCSGIGAVHFMLGFVRSHTLWPFIWYRLVLATAVIGVVMLAHTTS